MFKMFQALRQPRLLVVFLMGFFSGLPLLLTGSTLKAWLTQSDLDLKKIGLFSLVAFPSAWKFVWSPLMDRYRLGRLGRRRGWLILSQIGLAASLLFLSSLKPLTELRWVAIAAVTISFWSASQDIVIDAYRREILPDEELGIGASLMSLGYRLGMLLAGAGALSFAQEISWASSYRIMAAVMLCGIVVTFFSREPQVTAPLPKTVKESVVGPLLEFFKRAGAWKILAFILLYKIGESMASDMMTPFYIKIGFSNNEIASVAKLTGIWATILGGIAGAFVMVRLRLYRSLWFFGILQSACLLLFSSLAATGHSIPMLALAIGSESFTSGMASTAFLTFLASQTNKRFTATQYALFTSVIKLSSMVMGSTTGYLASGVGWVLFFVICAILTIPGLLMLLKIKPLITEST